MTIGENELIATREYDVPQKLVFRAWTTPDLLARWWGPQGFTNTFHECDMRPGGTWKFTMHGPDGVDYPNHNDFVEIVPLERIVLDHLSGHEFRVTATFEGFEGRTRVTFRQLFKKKEDFEQAKPICKEANEQQLDRLGKVLAELAY
ncbi:SRPBCC family protein [Paenibacillus sp. FSL H7-0331]|uniref:SRPBCC family protein n=1 Tax=Paenibacillus sp. FSL H7-0331 TaxID=1920421 RepID=UPI00096E1E13|nr:SRPBCC family protein [Paenibacillus sp. FSL H7-0331]OME98710.1 polyketide cyclase [Paenibacillus sp. FSL H7-0331]